jgi:hypothetical protein
MRHGTIDGGTPGKITFQALLLLAGRYGDCASPRKDPSMRKGHNELLSQIEFHIAVIA